MEASLLTAVARQLQSESNKLSTTQSSETKIVPQQKNISWKDELILYFYNEIIPYATDVWDKIDDLPEEESSEKSLDGRCAADQKSVESDQVSCIKGQSMTYARSTLNTAFYTDFRPSGANVIVDEMVSVVPDPNEQSEVEELSWMVTGGDEYGHIIFKNSNEYIGQISNKLPEGRGKYIWSDGACYEGEFKKGQISGKGTLRYPECSYYEGQFCNGLINGFGKFNPLNTTMFYNGHWKNGKKHGKGWMLYENGNFYDGDWYEDRKHGNGFRQYLNGTVYNGSWFDGQPNGSGIVSYHNNDFYNGEWMNGLPHGFGEFTWNATLTEGFALCMENIYQGEWIEGKRTGYGLVHFGLKGTKLATVFDENEKNGAGVMVCSDGTIIERNPLFIRDSIVHQSGPAVEEIKLGSRPIMRTQSRLRKQEAVRLSFVKRRSDSAPRKDGLRTDTDPTKVTKAFPDTLPKCSPMNVPVHGIPAYINLSVHIEKMIDKYCELTFNPTTVNLDPSTWKLHVLNGDWSKYVPDKYRDGCLDSKFEERKLRNTILLHYNTLENVYNKYASLTCDDQQIAPILSRMFLWQLYRDINTQEFGLSSIDIDRLLIEFPNSALESEHYPFEKIYLWQFLHSILLVAYKRYTTLEYFEEKKATGILSNMLKDFLNNYIIPNEGKHNGQCLWKYKHLLPITSVYSLYLRYGEPHTARTFLKSCCVKRGEDPPCYMLLESTAKNVDISCGTNMICTGINFIYMPEQQADIVTHPTKQCECPFDRDPFHRDMKVFRTLGPKKIVGCLSKVCPLVKNDRLVTKISYKLTFLEFYETLILCAQELIALYKNKENKLLNDAQETKPPANCERTSKEMPSTGTKKKGQKVKRCV